MAVEWRQLTLARFGGARRRPRGGLGGRARPGGRGAGGLRPAARGAARAALRRPGRGLIAWRLGASPLWIGLGAAYLALPGLALVWLRGQPQFGLQIVVWLLAVVWTTDILAYLVGRNVGGPRLAPRISPGKTWSGLCGGVVAAAWPAA